MANPVLVEVLRGPVVESRHSGALVLMDAQGKRLLELGDVERRVFPRSAVKPFQALPFVESGAADAYGFGPAQIAFSMASHSGEDAHADGAIAMLAKAGLEETCLACAAHLPLGPAASKHLLLRGREPGKRHNNCSGKHAGFLCTAVHQGLDWRGYEQPDHPLMRQIVAASEALTGAPHSSDVQGLDGCSIPTFAIPLTALARGYARYVTGTGLAPERAKAARRIMDAAMAEPFWVAGTKRFCTEAMTAFPGRVFAKTGAEGVFGFAFPQLGLAGAVKIDDGATRGSELVAARVIETLLGADGALSAFSRASVSSWAGEPAGVLRASQMLETALNGLPQP